MNSRSALLPAADPMSRHTKQAGLRNPAQMMHRSANLLPDTRRTENLLEETMIHDIYLMSATPWLEAATAQKFQHRTLTFAEMAAPGRRRGKGTLNTQKPSTNRAKGLFLALIEGVLHA